MLDTDWLSGCDHVLRLLSAVRCSVRCSVERFEIVVLRLNLRFWTSRRHFFTKKSKEANWPSGGRGGGSILICEREIYLGNIPGKFPKLQSLFSTSKFQSMAKAYLPVCTTNLQFPTVICCIHPLILPMSKTPSRFLNFLDFDVYVKMTPIFPTN